MFDPKNLNIAYIGGGSCPRAHALMGGLAKEPALSGTVRLYDADFESARINEGIGNALSARSDTVGKWHYVAVKKVEDSLIDADFVIISILPATLDEMESDVHAPEKFGIFQTAGDTTGPGGIVRGLRVVPMYERFAKAIKDICPSAWVINHTNPMGICLKTLYTVFPSIKAYGYCQDVSSAQNLLAEVIERDKEEIYTNVVGVNHFTFITKATCDGQDIFPAYRRFVDKNYNCGYIMAGGEPFPESYFGCLNKVGFDLFRRTGAIAAAADRHLAEFCPKNWYLSSPKTALSWGFNLIPVSYRKQNLSERLEKNRNIYEGKIPFTADIAGDERVKQIKSLVLGEGLVTNVNLPNNGQIDNLSQGGIVESNARLSRDLVQPIYAGQVPTLVKPHMEKALAMQELVVRSALSGDYEIAFQCFLNDNLVDLSFDESRRLFNIMLENTKAYLPYYETYKRSVSTVK